jgi:lipid-A-disaccharide synthase
MLVILPFEEEFYRQHGVSARFVGHPLVDLVEPRTDRAAAAAAAGLSPARPVLGLLPGSRRNELRELLPVLVQAAREVSRAIPGLQTVLPVANPRFRAQVDAELRSSDLSVTVVDDDFRGGVAACDAVLVASGTATLEVSLMQIPLVITYRVSPWTYRFVTSLTTVEHAGLPNLILGRKAVPERIQEECRADLLAESVLPLMQPTDAREEMLGALSELRDRLGGGGAIPRAADCVVELLRERGLTGFESSHYS